MDLTIHGVTKPVTMRIEKIGEGEGPYGKWRIGFQGVMDIKRSEFGMTNMIGPVGDDVRVILCFEGIRQ